MAAHAKASVDTRRTPKKIRKTARAVKTGRKGETEKVDPSYRGLAEGNRNTTAARMKSTVVAPATVGRSGAVNSGHKVNDMEENLGLEGREGMSKTLETGIGANSGALNPGRWTRGGSMSRAEILSRPAMSPAVSTGNAQAQADGLDMVGILAARDSREVKGRPALLNPAGASDHKAPTRKAPMVHTAEEDQADTNVPMSAYVKTSAIV